MSGVSIPPEIVDEIIDNVSVTSKERSPILGRVDDVLTRSANQLPVMERRDLKACSLVSHAWLSRSRYHLFRHVTLCQNRSPNISLTNVAPYVRVLELLDGRTSRGEKPWLSEALRTPRLGALTAVESVSISHGSFENLKDGSIATLFASFSALKSLRLHHCSFASIPQLAETVYSSVHLKGLALESVIITPARRRNGLVAVVTKRLKNLKNMTFSCGRTDRGLVIPVFPPRAPSQLQTLDISNCNLMGAMIGWLQAGDQTPLVDMIRLNITGGAPDMEAHSQLMRTLGLSVTSFTVDFTTNAGLFDMKAADIFSRNIDLGQNSCLRVIQLPFVGLYAHWEPFLINRAAHFPHLLARISSPCIEEVLMHVGIDSPRDLDRLEWVKLDQVLTQSNFDHLKRIVVAVSLGLSPMDTRAVGELAQVLLRRGLSTCHARGILVVEIKYVVPRAN